MADAPKFSEVFLGDGTEVMPRAIRVGDALYAWRVTSIDPRTGRRPEGPVEQMGQALRNMQQLLQETGLAPENVARATGYIRDPGDRDAVYQYWDELYPDPSDRPAFKVLIDALPEDEEAWLQMLAYAGERRTRFDIEGVPARDPTVRLGPWVFSSRVHGTDRTTSTVPAGAEMQVKLAYENLKSLVQQAGGQISDIKQITAYMRDTDLAPAVEANLRTLTESELPSVVLRNVQSFVRPEMDAMLEMSAAFDDGPSVIELSTPGAPGRSVPAGVQIGSLIYLPELRGIDYRGEGFLEGYEQQIRQALRNAELTLEAAGVTLDNVAQVTVYLRDLEGHEALNKVWPEFFADHADRPPHRYLPAALPSGVLAQVHVVAVRGARRTVLEIPGMRHSDPVSMGVRIGNLIFTSPIMGANARTGQMPDDPSAQAKLAVKNVQTLLSQAGAAPKDLSQITAFVADAGLHSVIESELSAILPKGSSALKWHLVAADLPGDALVSLEAMAAL
jgi:2-iminobutanoate/2-iminopropanoate deaminase